MAFKFLQKLYLCRKFYKMGDLTPEKDDFNADDQQKFRNSGFRKYGVYSSVVFQMMAIIALGFWGGKKLNDYLGLQSNLLTVGIGLLGLGLALYNTVKQLERINKKEKF